MDYKALFTPARIGKVRLKNRFAMAPMGPLGLADAQGGFNQRGIIPNAPRVAPVSSSPA